jgi:Xaa-Pro aminopeptidase
MLHEELEGYQRVQDAARLTLERITEFIRPGATELDLVRKCDELQLGAGVDGYWYKSLPALVLAGAHTTLAISRESYSPSESPIQENDLVTIDLNPSMAGYCGDYARSYYVEGRVARRSPQFDQEFLAGARAQRLLHAKLMQVAHEKMTFDQLYQIIHEEIDKLGFVQLDYLGHEVQKDMERLDFVEPGEMRSLGEAGLFTLEPQISLKGGGYGFKHENIYYFKDHRLTEL